MNESISRRPIRSRNTSWAASFTRLLIKGGISPNAISLFGMLAAIVAGAAFYSTSLTAGPMQRLLWLGGAALCQIRLLCNLFDGMVAVERKIASRRGEIYNEIPDRISDAVIFIGWGYAAGSDIRLGFIAALIALFVAYVRAALHAMGAPNDFCGPMAKPHRMAIVILLAFYLAIAPAAWRLPWGEAKIVLVIVIAGGALTAGRRILRGAHHLGTN